MAKTLRTRYEIVKWPSSIWRVQKLQDPYPNKIRNGIKIMKSIDEIFCKTLHACNDVTPQAKEQWLPKANV